VSSKKHVCVPNFLTKPPPHVFLGQKGLFGAFLGQKYFAQKLPSVLPPKPPKSFF
jgi:hypothetical protein